jgi:hypothetical protein
MNDWFSGDKYIKEMESTFYLQRLKTTHGLRAENKQQQTGIKQVVSQNAHQHINNIATIPSSYNSILSHVPQRHITSLFLVPLTRVPRIPRPLHCTAKHTLLLHILHLQLLLTHVRTRI